MEMVALALLPAGTSSLNRGRSRRSSSSYRGSWTKAYRNQTEANPVAEHLSSPFPGMLALKVWEQEVKRSLVPNSSFPSLLLKSVELFMFIAVFFL